MRHTRRSSTQKNRRAEETWLRCITKNNARRIGRKLIEKRESDFVKASRKDLKPYIIGFYTY